MMVRFVFNSLIKDKERPAVIQRNRILDAVVTIFKYNKIIIYHPICIKLFYDRTVSYITVSTDDVLNTINNEK